MSHISAIRFLLGCVYFCNLTDVLLSPPFPTTKTHPRFPLANRHDPNDPRPKVQPWWSSQMICCKLWQPNLATIPSPKLTDPVVTPGPWFNFWRVNSLGSNWNLKIWILRVPVRKGHPQVIPIQSCIKLHWFYSKRFAVIFCKCFVGKLTTTSGFLLYRYPNHPCKV